MNEYVAKMKCPYCDWVFGLNEDQLRNNLTFTCPNCHKSNQGSVSSDEDGNLIGEKSLTWAIVT